MGWFFGHWKLELPAWASLSLSLYSFVTNPETALWLGMGVRNAAMVVACALPPAMLAWYLLQATVGLNSPSGHKGKKLKYVTSPPNASLRLLECLNVSSVTHAVPPSTMDWNSNPPLR